MNYKDNIYSKCVKRIEADSKLLHLIVHDMGCEENHLEPLEQECAYECNGQNIHRPRYWKLKLREEQ